MMEWVVAAGLMAAVGAWRVRARTDTAPDPLYGALAEALEAHVEPQRLGGMRLGGTRGDVVWHADIRRAGKTWLTVVARSEGWSDVSLTRVNPAVGMGRRDASPIGEQVFDDAVVLVGDRHLLRAALDDRTRAQALNLLTRGGEIGLGTVRWSRSWLRPSPDELVDAVTLAVQVARALHEGASDPTARLARIATSSAVMAVRVGALRALTHRGSDAPSARAAAEALACHSHPEVRAWALYLQGGEEAWSLGLGVERSSEEISTLHWRQLSVICVGTARQDAIRIALSREHLSLQCLAAEHAALEPAHAPVAALRARSEELLKYLPRGPHRPLQEALVRGVGAWGSEHDQAWLLALVEKNDSGLGISAMASLARIGTVEAIPALRRAMARGVPLGRWRQAAEEAIRALQGSQADALSGSLSLTGDEVVGQVSLADPPDG